MFCIFLIRTKVSENLLECIPLVFVLLAAFNELNLRQKMLYYTVN